MDENCTPRSKQVDNGGMAQGLRLPNLGQGDGDTRGKVVEGKLSHPLHPKDGYALPDCKDPKAKRVLKFLIPTLYQEKPDRIMVTIGNTIFGTLIGEREVDWALVI